MRFSRRIRTAEQRAEEEVKELERTALVDIAMKKLYCALVGIFVVGFAILWWPRLDPQMVSVMRSEASDDGVVLEYRMSRAFAVKLQHGIRERTEPFQGTGIRVGGSKALRSERAGRFASSFDLLRGEHYVRLRFRPGPTLTVASGDDRVEIAAWLAPDASGITWNTPRVDSHNRLQFGDGVGNDVAYFVKSPEREEYLMLYAGTHN